MSPLFNEIGDHSYPFNLPATPRNKIILNWKHRVENSSDKYEFFKASVLWQGIELFSGSLRISKAGLSYEGTLYIDKGNFNWEIKNRMLHELNLGNLPFTSNEEAMAYYNSTLDKVYPQVSIAFPEIVNHLFYTPPTTDAEKERYNFPHSTGPVLWSHTANGNYSLLVPFIYLRWLLDKVATLFGYSMQDDFFSKTEELNNLVIYNSYEKNEYQMFAMVLPGTIRYQNHVPRIKVNEFFIGLENYFNCRFIVDNDRKTVTIKGATDILKSTGTVQYSAGVSDMTVYIPAKSPGMKVSMKPDEGDSVFAGIVDVDKAVAQRIKGSVSTVSELSNPPYIDFITMEDIWYVEDADNWFVPDLDNNGDIIWVVSTSIPHLMTFFPYKIQGGSSLNTASCFSTLIDAGYVLCGNLQSAYKEITPRLFFVKIENGIVVAKCQSDNLDLLFYNDNGIFAQFWKRWADWVLTERVSVQFKKDMDMRSIRDLDFSVKHEINGNNYLLSEVQLTIKTNSIQQATIKAFSCI